MILLFVAWGAILVFGVGYWVIMAAGYLFTKIKLRGVIQGGNNNMPGWLIMSLGALSGLAVGALIIILLALWNNRQ